MKRFLVILQHPKTYNSPPHTIETKFILSPLSMISKSLIERKFKVRISINDSINAKIKSI